MFHHSPLSILKKRSKVIFLSGVLIAIISLGVSMLFPLEYRADAQVLIISKTRTGVDPYTVVKSAERVGENIAQVMRTDDFFQKVIEQPGYQLDTSQFENLSEREKREEWQETIAPSVVFGTGVLNISAYHENQEQAKAYAGAAADALVAKGWEYVGGDVTMKVVNEPVVTKWPVRPNLVVNTLLGFIVGVIGMSVVVLQKRR